MIKKIYSLTAALWLTHFVPLPAQAPASSPITTFDGVRQLARDLAKSPYEEKAEPLDPFFANMEYDEHREILYFFDKAPGFKEKDHFAVEFFHPGWMYKKTIQFSEVINGKEVPFPCKPDLFHYGRVKLPPEITYPKGFAGFKVITPTDTDGDRPQCMVFMGASYFRVAPKGQLFGISSRAVAINTVGPEKEEFPDFKRFWLLRSGGAEKKMTLLALMDGPSITGAYQFEVTPGKEAEVHVTSEIYLRKPVKLLGLCPSSSMFWFGENTQPKPYDFRPEVHDSDGLLLDLADAGRFWRPLENSSSLRQSILRADKCNGFGIAQRDRRFESYQDLESNYHRRPSVWIQPTSDWGRGNVHLIEISTGEETWDNVVTFWEPAQQPKPGEPLAFSYTMRFTEDLGDRKLAKVTDTRRGHIIKKPNEELFVLEFARPEGSLGTAAKPPEISTTVGGRAELVDQRVAANPQTGGWRAFFRVKIAPEENTVELTCRLLENKKLLSEIWTYQWKR